MLTTRLNHLLTNHENPKSISARAHARRWEQFLQHFPNVSDMKVLDLGGRTQFWAVALAQPAHVTIVNLEPADQPTMGPR